MNRRSSSAKKVPRLRDRLREETEKAILQAAEETFGEHGLSSARMETIAARSGVSVGTLYNHFKDRDALLDALQSTRRAELLGRIDACLDELKDRPFEEQLRGVVGVYFGHLEERYQYMSILVQAELEGLKQAYTPKKLTAMKELYQRFDRLFARGHEQGVLRPEAKELLPTMFQGMLRGLMVRELLAERGAQLTGHVDAVVDVFLRGAGVKR